MSVDPDAETACVPSGVTARAAIGLECLASLNRSDSLGGMRLADSGQSQGRLWNARASPIRRSILAFSCDPKRPINWPASWLASDVRMDSES